MFSNDDDDAYDKVDYKMNYYFCNDFHEWLHVFGVLELSWSEYVGVG